MTAPNIVQLPGVAQEIQQGLSPFINALQVRKQQQLQQQQVEVQQQQVELQEIQQRSVNRSRAQDNILELMQNFGIDVLDDPAVVEITEQAGLNAPRLKQLFKEREKAAREAQEAANALALQPLPERIRPIFASALRLREQLGVENTQLLIQQGLEELGNRITEQDEEQFRAGGFGDIMDTVGLTNAQKLEEISRRSLAMAQIRAEEGPGFNQRLQNQLTEARTRASEASRQISVARLRDGTSSAEQLRAIVALQREVDAQLDLTNISFLQLSGDERFEDITLKTRDERIEILFGAAVARIVREIPPALSELTRIVPPPEQ